MIISPSPTAQPVHAQPPAQDATPGTDPRIASLKVIFPDFDDAVIHSVLESTNYDHDRALDVLLGMNDPSFVPPTASPPVSSPSPNLSQFQPAPTADSQRLSQEALDEQLARRLALEEQQAAGQTWPPPAAQGQGVYQPYQPRHPTGRNGWGYQQTQPQSQGQPGQGRDTMTEFQEGFSRIAESGKKTFSSLMSKVKAKMQEFEQGQGWSGSQNPPPPHPGQASYYPSYPQGQPQGPSQAAYAQPYASAQPPSAPGQQPWPVRASVPQAPPPRSEVLQPTATEPATQQPSYYDPNSRGYDLYGDDDEGEIQLVDHITSTTATTPASTAPAPAVTTTITAHGAATPPQFDRPETPPPRSEASSPPSYASPVASPPSVSLLSSPPPVRSFSPTAGGARGTMPGAPGGVDFSKLGLLPKRPISLVRPQSPPATSAAAPRVAAAHSESTAGSKDQGNESEFVENPFEDR